MKVVSVTPGARFPTAHELGNSTVRPQSKSVGHKTAGNGLRTKRLNRLSLPGRMREELAAAAAEITAANRTILVLKDGKQRFVKLSEYRP